MHRCSHDGHDYATKQQNGYGCCRSNGVSEIGDLLQDYLEKENKTSRKSNRARHVVSRFLDPCASYCGHLRKKRLVGWIQAEAVALTGIY